MTLFEDINLNEVDSIEYVNRFIGKSWKVNIKMLDGTIHERFVDATENIAIDWTLKVDQIEEEKSNQVSKNLPL